MKDKWFLRFGIIMALLLLAIFGYIAFQQYQSHKEIDALLQTIILSK